jgi:hypothetical protein
MQIAFLDKNIYTHIDQIINLPLKMMFAPKWNLRN